MPQLRWRLNPDDVTWTAVRAQGAGGQNVNKVSSAVHLRLDVPAADLPEALKARLLAMPDQRLTQDGVLVIKAQTHRTQAQNLDDAMARLHAVLEAAAYIPPVRKATKPTRGSQQRRVDGKKRDGATKALRGKVVW